MTQPTRETKIELESVEVHTGDKIVSLDLKQIQALDAPAQFAQVKRGDNRIVQYIGFPLVVTARDTGIILSGGPGVSSLIK